MKQGTAIRSIYYNRAGEPVGPLPVTGSWPRIYSERGLTLDPPEVQEAAEEVAETVTESDTPPPVTAKRGRAASSDEGSL